MQNKHIKIIVLLFTVIFFVSAVKGQVEERFDHLTRLNGLSHDNVYSIIQDKYGFMWFGTQDGLNKYDGYTFTKYYHETKNSNSLISSSFGHIFEDSKGNLWFGTYFSGLDCYDPIKQKFKHFIHNENDTNTISSNRIRCITEDKHGYIWVGTSGGGLNRIDPLTNEIVRYQNKPNDLNSLADNNVNSIAFDESGKLWIGTGVGLDVLDVDANLFSHYELGKESFDDNKQLPVRTLIIDHKGILWIGTTDGLFVLDPFSNEIREYNHDLSDPKSISSSYINVILEDSEGTIWVGTESGGLNKYIRSKNIFVSYQYDATNPYSISSNRIWSLFEDKSKILWIGTKSGGVNKLDLKRKKFYNLAFNPKKKNSIPHPSVSAITGDASGKIWIGTDGGGLCVFDSTLNEYISFRAHPGGKLSLSDDEIWSIFSDSKGRIWVGTHSGGLNLISKEKNKYKIDKFLHHAKDTTGLSNNQINAITEDKKGNIWVATRNGLNVISEDADNQNFQFQTFFSNFSDSNSLSDNYITTIYQDHLSYIWAGTYSEGLNRIDLKNNKITRYNFKVNDYNTLSSNSITVIFEDHLGTLWIGTSDGLNKLDRSNMLFKRYYRENGLPSNEIMGILEDNAGNLWISTTNGLSKFNPLNEEFVNFDISDGLVNDGFNWNASYKDFKGKIYFGTNSGMLSFYPKEIKQNDYIPPIVITSIKTLNNHVWVENGNFVSTEQKYTEVLELDYNNNIFTVEFAALDYTNPKENIFEYKIVGLDDNWINYGTKHSITVTNLEPGSYFFRVRGSNNDKVFNKTGVSIRIVVRPPFYKTRGFLFMSIVLAVLIITSVYSFLVKMKTNKILEEKNHQLEDANSRLIESQRNLELLNETKDKFFSIIAHDLRNPFNPLLSLTELLHEDYDTLSDEERKEFIREIRDGAKRLYDLLENLLQWSLSQTRQNEFTQVKLDMSELVNKNIALLKINAEKKNILIENNVKKGTYVLSDENMLNSIVRNLLNNALKFSPENTKITINSEDKGDKYQISVKDEGIGIKDEFIDKIFDFGFSKTKINKSKEKGSGLGLILCKEFVEKNHGEIWVESKVGEGSTFYFTTIKAKS
jgi:ligand-binding sensor domain-containing protein/signal transduction histidine kinase